MDLWRGEGLAEALPERQARLRLHRIISMAGQWRHTNQSLGQQNVKLKLHHPNGCQVCSVEQYSADCHSLLKKKGTKWSIYRQISIKIKVFRLCHNICWSSKMASDIQNRCRCTIQQLSFEVIQMVLGKNSGMAGQGSGEASCEHTASPGCRGHVHNANTSSRESTEPCKGTAADQNCNCSGGSTQSSGGYQRNLQLWWRHTGP